MLFSSSLRAIPVVLVLCAGSSAEIKVETERNPVEAATDEFRFATLPSPSNTDAGTAAAFTLMAGWLDGKSGGTKCLNDGRLPTDADQPEANFFLTQRTTTGRLLVTLKEDSDVQAIHAYSWHPDVRAPQVFRVYGDGGDAKAAVPQTVDDSPADAGWQLIAAVATRPPEGPPGGQYAVRIANADGALGRHRRLLFDMARADPNARWGQTFFSEIDILDGREYAAPPAPATDVSVLDIQGKYEIRFDTTETGDLKPWVESKLKPVCNEWYPRIVEMFPSEGYTAPRRFTITFHDDMDGVAHCSGTHVHCAARWFRQNLDGEAAGAVVHEMVHVVQQFGRSRGGGQTPGWLVEGLADYVRWFLYEPATERPHPDPATARYTDSYRTTGAFLAWIVEKQGADVVKGLNAALRDGTYTPADWERLAGGTVDDLWAEYVKALEKK